MQGTKVYLIDKIPSIIHSLLVYVLSKSGLRSGQETRHFLHLPFLSGQHDLRCDVNVFLVLANKFFYPALLWPPFKIPERMLLDSVVPGHVAEVDKLTHFHLSAHVVSL